MLKAAVLSALARERPRLISHQPQLIQLPALTVGNVHRVGVLVCDQAGENVTFTAQLGHPEAVDDVDGAQPEVHLPVHRDVCDVVERHQGISLVVQFFGVFENPAVALAYHVDRVGIIVSIRVDVADQGDHRDADDEEQNGRRDRPRHLQPGVPVDLAGRWRIRVPLAIAQRDQKDPAEDAEHDH